MCAYCHHSTRVLVR